MRAIARRWLINQMPAGLRLALVGRRLRRRGEPEAALLPQLVEPGSTVIDVGAHTGHYSYLLARLVGKTGLVISVEPFVENARVLKAAARQLRLPIRVIVCALSSREGTANFYIPIDHGQPVSGLASLEPRPGEVVARQVSLRRLDQLTESLEQPVSFIKIDAEGHEFEILKGAERTLRQYHPSLLVEIEERHSSRPIADTFQYLSSCGYQGHFLDAKGELQPLSSFDVNVHQRAHLTDTSSRYYINNFVFKEHGY